MGASAEKQRQTVNFLPGALLPLRDLRNCADCFSLAPADDDSRQAVSDDNESIPAYAQLMAQSKLPGNRKVRKRPHTTA